MCVAPMLTAVMLVRRTHQRASEGCLERCLHAHLHHVALDVIHLGPCPTHLHGAGA